MRNFSINKEISLARTMPSEFYLNNSYHKSSIEKIFKNSWQFILLNNQMKKSIYPFRP